MVVLVVHENKYVNKKECRVGERPREGLRLVYSWSKNAGSQYLFNGVKMERKRMVSVRMRRVDDGVWRSMQPLRKAFTV
ncbi:hypothetical protein OL205_002522 [Salmonella enterica]|nr:hypothetical protein [Salmonella enterica]